MLSLHLFIQRCVSGIHWYLMVKERGGGKKEEKKTVKLLPWLLMQPFLFHKPTFIFYPVCCSALIYLRCLKCPAVEENPTQPHHSWLALRVHCVV